MISLFLGVLLPVCPAGGGEDPANVPDITGLVKALEDKNARVRANAARALGRLATTARPAIPALLRASEDGRVCPCLVDGALERIRERIRRRRRPSGEGGGKDRQGPGGCY